MSKEKIILLHAPSVYDFRKRITLWGPISDLIPSNPVFDMYPIGFASIAEYLERHGHRTRIINLAVRMLLDPEFEAEKLLSTLNPVAFGIDLHWLPHAHGALEIAQLIKKIHPQIPVIVGGFSSSYFHEEIITNYSVDFVLRGDSTEEPLRQLIECIDSGAKPRDLKRIPNLTWKDANGISQVNPFSYVPVDLDGVLIDYNFMVNAVIRDLNLLNNLPFAKWLKYPITVALTCRGCTCNCTVCGGSAYSSGHFFNRSKPAYRSPEVVALDLRKISQISRGPMFILGDIRQAGMDYAYRLLNTIQGIDNQVILEFFWPVDRSFMEEVAAAIKHFIIQISPESHDEVVQRYSGKPFSDNAIRTSIEHILAAGCKRMDVFFMSGLPGQTPKSVIGSIDYCSQLSRQFNGDERLKFFISPLAPFLDPCSLAYEKPKMYGYKKYCHTLEDHRNALLAPSWKYILSYETRWISRAELVECTYQAALKLNRLKAEYGHIKQEQAMITEERILLAIELMKYIDQLVETRSLQELQKELLKLRPKIERVNNSTVCEKDELDLPADPMPLKVMQAAGLQIGKRLKNL